MLWEGNDLVDVTSGMRVHEDGSISRRTLVSAYPFDRAIGLRGGGAFWSVAYANRQTKAILSKDGKILRELARSFYFAAAYDYPIALARGPAEDVLLIHCPKHLNILEIEDAETGRTLATRKVREMEFHSRLAVSPDSRHLLDAGWFWHPVGGAWLCSLSELMTSEGLEAFGHAFSFGAEIDSVAFQDDDHVVVSSTDEVINEEIPPTGIGPRQLGLWSIPGSCWRSCVNLDGPSGAMMPWKDWVILFYEFPKAVEIGTGKIVHRWDKLYSGRQVGSIDLGDPPPPQIALDPKQGRFAVQGPEGITIVSLEVSAFE